MTHGTIERQFGAELENDLRLVAESIGCEILEADFQGGRLQIVLDHPEGTTISHCEEVSRRVSDLLDVSDFGDTKYVLEVSSPGLDRKLYGPRDYERFAGRSARITWVDPEIGKRTDVGRLAEDRAAGESGHESVRLEIDGDRILEVPIATIVEARLEIEI